MIGRVRDILGEALTASIRRPGRLPSLRSVPFWERARWSRR